MGDCKHLEWLLWTPGDEDCLRAQRTQYARSAPNASVPRCSLDVGTLEASCAPPRSCVERGSNRSCVHRSRARTFCCSNLGNYIKTVSSHEELEIM